MDGQKKCGIRKKEKKSVEIEESEKTGGKLRKSTKLHMYIYPAISKFLLRISKQGRKEKM